MLRITVHKDGRLCRLKLVGRLGGPWVPETDKAWRSAFGPVIKQIEIDIKEITTVDDYGRELLAAMHQAGARLVTQGVEMTALVEEPETSPRSHRVPKQEKQEMKNQVRSRTEIFSRVCK